MNIGFVTLSTASTQAEALIARIAHDLGGVYEPRPENVPLDSWLGAQFAMRDAVVIVGDLPQAVRAVAPLMKGPIDPAVAVVDAEGRCVVPVLDDARQRAYPLCAQIAEGLKACAPRREVPPVVLLEEWALARNFAVENPAALSTIRTAQLREKPIGFFADVPVKNLPEPFFPSSAFQLGVAITPRTVHPFDATLLIRPRVLTLGVEIIKKTTRTAIEEAVVKFLGNHAYSPFALGAVAAAEWQASIPALRAFCDNAGVPLRTFSKRELILAESARGFSSMRLSLGDVGVDCISERAAALCGELAAPMTYDAGVTVALALAVAPFTVEF